MMKKGKSGFRICAALIMSVAIMATSGVGSVIASAGSLEGVSTNGKYYATYGSTAEAQEAAREVAFQIAAEGFTLLKNQNSALPLLGQQRVSVFGVASDSLATGTGTVAEALEAEGFAVNPALKSYYASVGTTRGSETPYDNASKTINFSNIISNSFGNYRDAAIVVLSRQGSEGSDLKPVTGEDLNDEVENIGGWEHEGALAENGGTGKKHDLQMTDSEYALLNYVKAQGFKKIIYIMNESQIFEVSNLENDPAVDGILWIGRPGVNGVTAMAQILSGKINPSGKTTDTWYKDFTADPTWYNVVTNAQQGSSTQYLQEAGGNSGYYGVDYEEGIYVGYRYYETAAYEASQGHYDFDYDDAVVYPFGYGLSYTEFAYSNFSVKSGAQKDAGIDGTGWASAVGSPASIKTLEVSVDVTNTGSVAGKEAVEIYVNAPYNTETAPVEKSHVKLVGFGKTDELLPGATQTLKISVNVQDMASYDALGINGSGEKGYVLEDGGYTIMAMGNAHEWTNPASATYQEVKFTLANDIMLHLDDYSGFEIKNLFSAENGMYYTLRDNKGAYQFNKDTTDLETQLSRANFAATFPKAPTEAALTMTDNMYKSMKYWNSFTLGNAIPNTVIPDNSSAETPVRYADGQTIENIVAPADFPWVAEATANAERMAGWDQTGEYGIMLSEMTGLDPNDNVTVIADGKFAGKTHQQAWDTFMNTLTWNDLKNVVGQYQSKAFNAVGMNAMSASEGSTSFGGITWTCNTICAATWNTDLLKAKGTMIGELALQNGRNAWWGGGANTHRSPFGGRWNEYTSEDPILGGYISAAEFLGASSKGLASFMKHCALNDQETNRNSGNMLSAWVSEQAIREIYYKSFQIAAQEGQSMAEMAAFAAAGRVAIGNNYNITTQMFKYEWGCETLSHTTDNYGGYKKASPIDLLVRGGIDNTNSGTVSGTWDAENKAVMVNGAAQPTQWYVVRRCAETFLWLHANSAMNKNGVDTSFIDYETKEYDLKYGASANIAPSVDKSELGSEDLLYSATGLPEGFNINGTTGVISGSSNQLGTYNVSVTVKVDGWVSKSVTIKINILPTLSLEAGTPVPEDTKIETTVKVGDNYQGRNGRPITAIECSLLDAIPGLTLSEDGTLTGTPTTPGEYEVRMQQKIYYTQNGSTRNANQNVNVLIVVTGDGAGTPGPADEIVFSIVEGQLGYTVGGGEWTAIGGASVEPATNGQDGVGIKSITKTSTEGLVDTYTITLTNDQTYTFTVTNGKDGAQGAQGAQGPAGPQGPQGEKGETGAQGEKGETGAQGEKGEKGDKGDTGATGETGAQGPKGDKGDKGEKGDKGDPGEAGKGCSGAVGIGGGIAAVIALIGAAMIVRKKEK